jgi:arabinose-5-phosphate isomerase
MRTGPAVPTVGPDATVAQALFEITGKGMGMTAVVNADGTLAGIFTDGDLRRCLPKLASFGDFNSAQVADFMTRTPITVHPDELAVDAVGLLETRRKQQLLVLGADGRLVGALNMFDLLQAKVV